MSTTADGAEPTSEDAESTGDDAADREPDVATDTIDLDAYDGPTESLSLVEGVRDGLELELARDDSVVVLGEDVGTNGGVFRATEHLQDEFGPNRVIDTPLAESAIVGSSIGLALSGMRPVAEMQFMGFASPAYDQLVSHAAAMRSRSHGQYTLPMVVRMPYGGGIAAPEHHSESREAAFVHEPGLKVVTPSTPTDAKGLIAAAVRDPDPVIVLEPKRLYRAFREDVPEKPYTVPIGEASVRREGEDVSLFTWGASTQPALAVAEDLAEANGIDVEVVDLRSLSPLDVDTIAESVKKTGRAAVVHEAPKTAGVGAEVVATINEEALYYLEAPVTRVTGFDTPVPLSTLEDFYLPQALRIREGVLEAVEA